MWLGPVRSEGIGGSDQEGGGDILETLATWLAPAATMVAAMMTAANPGARVTGWGFVVFTVGSICWSFIGISTKTARGDNHVTYLSVFALDKGFHRCA